MDFAILCFAKSPVVSARTQFQEVVMSFPEYLKARISEDYKNLIIQKLEEIKNQTQELKNGLAPSLFQSSQNLKDSVQKELARILDVMDSEFSASQAKLNDQLTTSLEEYQSSWYHSDISAFQQQLEMLISDIVSNVPVPPKKENADLASLTELMGKLEQGNTQSEILNIVLHQVSTWADRAVLFVVKADQATGWAAFGLEGWDTNRIRQIRVNLSHDTVLRDVVNSGQVAFGAGDKYADNGEIFSILGSNPQSALACPVMVRGKIAGILYADLQEDLSNNPDVPNLLYLASRFAGSAIDLLPTRPKPTPGKETQAPAAAPAPARPAPPAAPAPAPAGRPDVPTMVTAPAAPPPVIEVIEMPAPTPKAAAAQSEPTMISVAVPPPDDLGTVVMSSIKPPVEIDAQDQKLHDDAKRFARLLVSEIKLYNEAQVSAGRENKDLYDRLKEDIERSRRMYMERVPQHVHSTTNYFYEELVRTLANGDPTVLGM